MNTDKIAIAQEFVLNIRGTTHKLTKEEAKFLRDELDAMLDDKPKIPTGPIYRGPEVPHTPMIPMPIPTRTWEPAHPYQPNGPTCAVPTDAEVTNALATR